MSDRSCGAVKNWSEFYIDLLLIAMFSALVLFMVSPFIALFLCVVLTIMGKFYMALAALAYAGLVGLWVEEFVSSS